jgi:hypothetical protein
LVVKNGSKSRALISGVMPVPVSLTGERGVRAGGDTKVRLRVGLVELDVAVSMVSVPPRGMASRAFTARFMTICSTWPRSALTSGRSGHSRAAP